MKKMIITGIICVAVGIAVCGAAYALSGRSVSGDLSDSSVYFPSDGINKINIGEHVAAVKIFKSSDNSGEIKIEAENIILSEFKASEKNGVLEILYNPTIFKLPFISMPIGFGYNKFSVINIYIPEGKIFDEVKFGGGVGTVNIEDITAGEVIINGGVGTYDIKDMTAGSLRVDGGVGSVKINGVINGDAKIGGGVGTVELSGEVNGDIRLSTGVGTASLDLKGDAEDYNIRADRGVGRIRLNGNKIPDTIRNGGKYDITVSAGVGDININIK
ncbi:MAG: DUF4097 domain-containing protein [Oscillospiraceae bacterium]|nr:DUF4097 domain-containing protein [Oscillospiraceae bacterium]